MKKVLFLLVMAFVSMGSFAQTQWKADPNHSSLNFEIAHSGISIVNGKFLEYTGDLTTDGEGLSNAVVEFNVQVKSVNTNVEQRDNHLRTPDFFDVEKYPTMSFKSTKIEPTDKPDTFLLHGKLTIKDVTKDVVFDVHYGGTLKSEKGDKLGVDARTTINRFDYNINFDPGATGVGKDVNIVIHLEFGQKK